MPGRLPAEVGRGISALVGVRTALAVAADVERRSPKGSLMAVVALLAAMELRLWLEAGRGETG